MSDGVPDGGFEEAPPPPHPERVSQPPQAPTVETPAIGQQEQNIARTIHQEMQGGSDPDSITKKVAEGARPDQLRNPQNPQQKPERQQTEQSQRELMKELGMKEGVGELQATISEDPRYQKLLEEEGAQDKDAQMRALDKFGKLYPREAKLYEKHSIWFGEDSKPDVREDLYYGRVYRQVEALQRDRLLAVKAEHDDPVQQLDAMAEQYEQIHCESIRDVYSEYNREYAEKAAIYRDAGGQYNLHNVDLNTFAEERLAELSLSSFTPEQQAVGKEFHRFIVKSVLGSDAPDVPLNQDLIWQLMKNVDRNVDKGEKESILANLLKLLARAIGRVGKEAASMENEMLSSQTDASAEVTPKSKIATPLSDLLQRITVKLLLTGNVLYAITHVLSGLGVQ